MTSESRLARFFIGTLIFTTAAWSLAFVFAAMAGEMPFPKTTLKKATSHFANRHEVKESLTETLEGVENIEISVAHADVSFTISNDDSLHLDYSGQTLDGQKALAISRSGSILSLKIDDEAHGGFNISFGDDDSKLEVRVPKKFNKTLTFKGASGGLKIHDLTLASLGAKLASGDITLEGVVLDNGKLKTSSGNIEVSRYKGSLQVEATSGNIDIKGYSGNGLEARTTSGNVDLAELNTDSIEVQATSGNVKAHVGPGDDWHLRLRAISGDVENQIGDHPASKRKMSINVTSGNITVLR